MNNLNNNITETNVLKIGQLETPTLTDINEWVSADIIGGDMGGLINISYLYEGLGNAGNEDLLTVNFNREFETTPIVLISPYRTNDDIINISIKSVSQTGFILYLGTTDTTTFDLFISYFVVSL